MKSVLRLSHQILIINQKLERRESPHKYKGKSISIEQLLQSPLPTGVNLESEQGTPAREGVAAPSASLLSAVFSLLMTFPFHLPLTLPSYCYPGGVTTARTDLIDTIPLSHLFKDTASRMGRRGGCCGMSRCLHCPSRPPCDLKTRLRRLFFPSPQQQSTVW